MNTNIGYEIIKRIFLERNSKGLSYQDDFNSNLSHDEAAALLDEWAREFGADDSDIARIQALAASDEITSILQRNVEIVNNQVHAKGIPTMIYNNAKHTGMFKTDEE